MAETQLSSVKIYRALSTAAGEINHTARQVYDEAIDKTTALAEAETIIRNLATNLGITI